MDPVTVAVEKKVAASAWDYILGWFTRNRDQKKKIEALEAELADVRSGQSAFEKLMSELVCRPKDDHMYWKKDGSGGPYCPLCLDVDKKRVPLIHGNRNGCFECNIHQQSFETDELRQRERQAILDRAAAGRRRSRFGPTQWS